MLLDGKNLLMYIKFWIALISISLLFGANPKDIFNIFISTTIDISVF